VLKKLAELRSPEESPAVRVVVERTDSKLVAGAEDPAGTGIPDDVCKVTYDKAGGLLTPPLVCAKDQFGVGRGARTPPEGCLKVVSIVYTTIQGKPQARRFTAE
jgi:hypothetical protein